MKFTHEMQGRITVIRITGELTADNLDPVKKLVTDRLADGCDFVLDCSELEFVDSRGLELLLWIQERAAEQLGQIRLVAPSDNIRTILHVTRLERCFQMHPEMAEAMRSLK